MQSTKNLLTDKDVARTLDRLASEIVERRGNGEKLAIVGIQRRGVDLALRIKKILDKNLETEIPLGKLDINLYRDDWTNLSRQPSINKTEIPFDIEDTSVILVDDVLFSGRTIRAALEAILDFGRPRRVELLVLVDRGHRELPIRADYVGKEVATSRDEHVNVYVYERDGEDKVVLSKS